MQQTHRTLASLRKNLMQQRNKKYIAPALLILSALLIFYGAVDGEAAIVLRKATKICLECIGVG